MTDIERAPELIGYGDVSYCAHCYGQVVPPGNVGCVCGDYGVPVFTMPVVIACCVFVFCFTVIFAFGGRM